MIKTRLNKPAQLHIDQKSRRMFLKSAGGLSLALPMLPSLLTLGSEKALAATDPPLRFVSFINDLGGLQYKNWYGTNLPTTAFETYPGRQGRVGDLSSLVGPNGLSPVIDSNYNSLFPYMNIVAGVDAPMQEGHNGWVAMGGFSEQNFPKPGLGGNFPTIDQVMGYAGANGKGIYGATTSGRRRFTPVATMYGGASWVRDDFFNQSSDVYHGGGIGCLYNVSGLFSYLFGNVTQANSTLPAPSSNPLLNLVNEFWPSGRALIKYLSSADRIALDQLFSLAQDAAADYVNPPPVVNVSGPPPGTSSDISTVGAQNAIADIISMAFQCDITRIVTMQVNHTYQGLNWHGATHAPYNTSIDEGQSDIVQIHQNFSKNLIARLGSNLLAADPFSSGTSMLNNSLMMWSSEEKCAHHNWGMPIMLLGGAGGRIQTGKFADLRDLSQGNWDTDVVGDKLYRGDLINRLWSSIFYGSLNTKRLWY